jgi:ankyrin repeat protein
MLSAVLFLTVNALFDPGRSQTFAGTITSVQCYKGECALVVIGAPAKGAASSSIMFYTIDGASRSAQAGDSALLTIGPGLFHRQWVASHVIHPVHDASLVGSHLTSAAAADDTASVRSLLDAGVSADAIDERNATLGETALMAAAAAGNRQTIAVLLARGANPNHENLNGETALMRAVESRDLPSVRLLLASGANPGALTRGRHVASVMDIALRTGDTTIIHTIGAALQRQRALPHE